MQYAHRSNPERQRFEFVWWVPKDEAAPFGGVLQEAVAHYPAPRVDGDGKYCPQRWMMSRLSRTVNAYADRVEHGQTRSDVLTLILCDRSFEAALYAVRHGGLHVEESEHAFGRVIPLHVIQFASLASDEIVSTQ